MTKLSPGGLAILGFDTTGSAIDFSFVLLDDVAAGTEIYFTDVGVLPGSESFGNTSSVEGLVLWTAPADISAGTVVNYAEDSADFSQPLALGVGGFNQPVELTPGGEQLIAFQGALDSASFTFTDIDMLFALSNFDNVFQGTGDGESGDPTATNQTGLPAGLTAGATALALGPSGGFADALVYTGITSGTRAALQAAIADPTNWNAPTAPTVSDLTQVVADFTVTDAVTNDDPVLSVPGDGTTDEDTAFAVSGITVSDTENDVITLTVEAQATLDVTATGMVAVAGANTGVLTIIGNASDVNATVSSLQVTPPQDSTDDILVQVRATDNGVTFASGTFTIAVTPVDDPTQIVALPATENITDVLLASDGILFATEARLEDPDGPNESLEDFALIIGYGGAGSDTGDVLSIIDTVVTDISLNDLGISTTFNGTTNRTDILFSIGTGTTTVVIGSIEPTQDGNVGSALRIDLTANATPSNVQQLLDAVRFSNPAASAGTRELVITLRDSLDQQIDQDTQVLTILESNDTPVLADFADTLTIDTGIVGTTLTRLDPDVSLSDTDSPDFNGGNLRVEIVETRPGADLTGEIITFDTASIFSLSGTTVLASGMPIGTITSDGLGGSPLQIDFTSADATLAVVEQLIEALSYSNTATTPETTRQLQITVADGDGAISAPQTIGVTIDTVTPPPTPDRVVEYVEQQGPVFIDDLGQFTADGVRSDQTVYAGASLVVGMSSLPTAGVLDLKRTAGVEDGDVFIVNNDILLVDSAATFGYVRLGVLDPGSETFSLVIAFEATDGTFVNTSSSAGFFAAQTRRPTAEEVELVVQALQYDNTDGDDPTAGTRLVTITLTPFGGANEPVESFEVDVIAVPDAPVLDNFLNAVGFTYMGSTPPPPQLLNQGVETAIDPDTTDFNGGRFDVIARVTTADDNFSIIDGNGITVSGNQVSFLGVVIGTVSGGQNGSSLVVEFTGTTSQAAVEALIAQIGFVNTSGSPLPQRSIAYRLTDGDGTASDDVVQNITISGSTVLQPPILSHVDSPVTPLSSALLDGSFVTLDSDIALSDADASGFDGGSLSLEYVTPRGPDTSQLGIATSGTPGSGIEVSGASISFDGTVIGTIIQDGVDGAALQIDLSGAAATIPAVEALIEALQYASSDTVPTGTVELRLTVTDAEGQASSTVPLVVTIVDDGITFDDTETGSEDNDVVISFVDLLANDVNFGPGVTIASVQDPVNGTVQIVGSTVVFTPTPDYNGPASFSYTASDGVWTSTATVELTLAAVEDAPVLTNLAGDAVAFQQGFGPVAIDAAGTGPNNQGLSPLALGVGDVDSSDFDGGLLTVTITGGGSVAEDVLTFDASIVTVSGPDTALDPGDTLSVGGVVVGTIAPLGTGAGGAPLIVALGADATPERVETLMQALQYDNVSSTPSTTPRQISVTLSDGDGAISASTPVTVNIQPPSSGAFTDSGQSLGSGDNRGIALGDLDGDGDLDVVVTKSAGAPNLVWFNDGAGTFTDSGQALGMENSYIAALGDLDGDGDLDMVVSNFLSGNTVLLNDGTGTFTDTGQSIEPGLNTAVTLGDLDGDGDLDFVVADLQANSVWLNDGTGTFTSNGQMLGTGISGESALGDVDGDGDLDMVVANNGANTVWLNDGSGIFSDTLQTLGTGESRAVALGDVDGDGDLDMVVGNSGPGANTVWLNDGAGNFTDSGQALGMALTQDVTLGDLDGDGDLDIVEVKDNSGGSSVDGNAIWLNDGTGSFAISSVLPNTSTSSEGELGDVDFDGDLDLVLASIGGVQIWRNNQQPELSLADTPQSYVETDPPLLIDPAATLVDGDGDTDWDGGTLTIQITGNAEADDRLSIADGLLGPITAIGMDLRNGATVIGTVSATNGIATGGALLTITFNANATNALVQQVLQLVQFASTSDSPGLEDRTLSVTATDAVGASVTDTRVIELLEKALDTTGTIASESYDGSGLDDNIDGRGGDDTAFGNGGNDTLFGGNGDDSLNGGDGNDSILGSFGNDTLIGGSGDDLLSGDDGEDSLEGGNGNDSMNGGDGNDILLGESGDDTLNGREGRDTLIGGNGEDTLVGDDGDDLLRGGSENDLLFGDDGQDTLVGNHGDDRLRGGRENDTLIGGAGQDTLAGQGGDDRLTGGSENDLLDGGAGSDLLIGDTGDDRLIGGLDDDTFRFASGFGNDTIIDFDALSASEKIDLRLVTEITDFADLLADHAQQDRTRVLIDDGNGNTIQLKGVLLSDLDAGDFIF